MKGVSHSFRIGWTAGFRDHHLTKHHNVHDFHLDKAAREIEQPTLHRSHILLPVLCVLLRLGTSLGHNLFCHKNNTCPTMAAQISTCSEAFLKQQKTVLLLHLSNWRIFSWKQVCSESNRWDRIQHLERECQGEQQQHTEKYPQRWWRWNHVVSCHEKYW